MDTPRSSQFFQGTQPKIAPLPKKGGLSFLVKILIAVVVIIFIAIIAGGAVLATRIWDPVWNPMRPKPEVVILKAWNQLKEIKSQNFDAGLVMGGKNVKYEDQSVDFNVDLKVAGGVDISDKNNMLSSITSSVGAWANDGDNQYNFAIAGETRQISKVLYIKINQLDLGNFNMFLMMMGIDTSKIKNQWIKYDLNDAIKDANLYAGVPTEQQTEEQKNLKDVLDQIAKILLDKKVYDINQFSDNRGAEGKEYHYIVSLNREKFMAASPEIFDVLEKYSEKSGQKPTEEYTLEKFQKGLNDIFDKLGPLSMDLFIGKQDNFFHKIQLAKTLDVSKFDNQYSGTVQIDYKIEQSSINKPVEVSAPAEYKTFEELFPPVTATPAKTKVNSNQSTAVETKMETREACGKKSYPQFSNIVFKYKIVIKPEAVVCVTGGQCRCGIGLSWPLVSPDDISQCGQIQAILSDIKKIQSIPVDYAGLSSFCQNVK